MPSSTKFHPFILRLNYRESSRSSYIQYRNHHVPYERAGGLLRRITDEDISVSLTLRMYSFKSFNGVDSIDQIYFSLNKIIIYILIENND